jgi:hypothetical protein
VGDFLYLFLDEGGNLDFSLSGTRYFILTCLTKQRPFEAYKSLYELKYDLIEQGTAIDRFHATEDRQEVRNKVFKIIRENLTEVRVDSIIVEKRKTDTSSQSVEKFYPRMMSHLLESVFRGCDLTRFREEVLVFTDSLPVKKKEEAIKKGIKENLGRVLPGLTKYRIYHHDSRSNLDLQIVDYINWAIYRKWNNNDLRSYELIKPAIASESDIFQSNQTFWY